MMAYWRRQLLQGATLPKYVALPDRTALSGLSARQMKSVGNMARAQLASWLTLLEARVRRIVSDSSLDDETKLVVRCINKRHAWWAPALQLAWKADGQGVLQPCSPKAKEAVLLSVDPRHLKMARRLAKAATKTTSFPDMRHVDTIVLDRIVADAQRPAGTGNPNVAWWVKTTTLTKGRPIAIGLLVNTHFEQAYEEAVRQGGGLCGVVQLHRAKGTREFSMSLVLDTPDAPERTEGRVVGLDFGFADALLASSDGQLFGRKAVQRLRDLDQRLAEHDAWLARRGLRRRGDRTHERLNARIRGLVTNEVGRIINRLALNHTPGQIRTLVLERLDFRGGGMSRRMNRLITRTGRAALKHKLEAIRETTGIGIAQVPAQYTSQECSGCGHTSRRNRPERSRYSCRFCGKTQHADINAARVIASRRSWQQPDDTGPKARRNTLQLLDWRFRQRWGRPMGGAAPDVAGAPGGRQTASSNGEPHGTDGLCHEIAHR